MRKGMPNARSPCALSAARPDPQTIDFVLLRVRQKFGTPRAPAMGAAAGPPSWRPEECSLRRLCSPWILSPLACLALGLAWTSPAHADDLPHLKWGEPVRCMKTPKGEEVRVQCEHVNGQDRCLAAPNKLSHAGRVSRAPR